MTIGTELIVIGALPSHDGTALPLETAIDRRCLTFIEGSVNGTYTWLELITEYANQAAVHFDVSRPVAWDIVSTYTCGHIPTIDFMLYRFTLAAIELGNKAIQAAGEGVVTGVDNLTTSVRWSRPFPSRRQSEIATCPLPGPGPNAGCGRGGLCTASPERDGRVGDSTPAIGGWCRSLSLPQQCRALSLSPDCPKSDRRDIRDTWLEHACTAEKRTAR